LGDFINSNPVLVKNSVNMGYGALPSGQGGGDTRYTDFLTAKAARTPTIFVGSNDGMLHAFKDTLGSVPADDGKEVFAYVPKTVIANLKKLADKTYGTTALYHQFYLDGPLMETDAFVNAPGATSASWRNYVLGSLGAGGRAIFALDVTNTASLGASTVRWELSSTTQSDLGYVTAPIEVGVLQNGEWVAVFGNGSFSGAGKATLFVVNLQSGAVQTLDVETTTGTNGLGGVGVVRNASGQITNLYAGDLKGKVWKFDYLSTAASRFEVSGGTAFFTAAHTDTVAQPITHAPILFDHSKGGKIVVFGTGVLATETDANSTATQAIYGVWDKVADTVTRPMTRSLLEPRSLTSVAGSGGAIYYSLAGIAVDWDGGKRGWVINLDVSSGLRVIYPSQRVSSKIALISVLKPASTVVACESSTGSGLNLLIPVEEGVNPTYRLFDTDGSGTINSSDALVVGYETNADGIDAIVRSTPVCSGGTCKTAISLQSATGQRKANIEDDDPSGGTGSRTVKDRVWRRIINPPIR
jgi:type IV pilus assembly protein PilY1